MNGVEFRSITEQELPDVIQFLESAFGPGIPAFRPEVMRWKAFAPHPLWEGSRSYVLTRGGKIAAHGLAMPLEIRSAAGSVRSAVVIDWVGSKSFPGSGALLYKKALAMVGSLVGIGGSPDARRTMPKLGFQLRSESNIWRRVLRPFARYRADQQPGWRPAARLLRDLSRLPMGVQPASGWSMQAISRFDDAIAPVMPKPGMFSDNVSARSPALLNYFLGCPAASMQAFTILDSGKPAGYAILSTVGAQCRVADLWLNSAKKEDWATAYALLSRVAAENPAVHDFLVPGFGPQQESDWPRTGFQLANHRPVSFNDPGGMLQPAPLPITLVETDAFYL